MSFSAHSTTSKVELAKQYITECKAKVYVHLPKGQVDSAIFWTYETLSYLRRENINDSLLLGKQYNFISYIEGILGHRSTSISFADSAILALNSQDTLTADILYSYRQKGRIYQSLGDFYRANVALEMAHYIEDSLKQASEVLNALGSNEVHIGNLSKAESYFKAFVSNENVSRQAHMIGVANLIDLYLDLGKLDEATELWKEVDAYIESSEMQEDPILPDFLQIKANFLQAQGYNLQSIEVLRKAIELLEKQRFGKRKAEKFRCDLVSILLKSNVQEAKLECQKTYHYFTTQKEERKDPFELVSAHLMANCSYEQYKENKQKEALDSCLLYAQQAQEVSDELRNGFLYRNSKYKLASYLKANTELGIDAAYEFIERGQIKEGQALLFYFMEKGKSQVLLDELNEKQRVRLKAKGRLEELYKLELKKIETEDSLKKLELSAQIEAIKSQLQQEVKGASEQENRFHIPTGTSFTADLEQLIQLSKQSNTVFIEFGEGKEQPYLIVMNKGVVTQRQIEVPKDSLDVLIRTHLSKLKNPTISAKDYTSTAGSLYALLLGPLKIEEENIVVIPSALTASLPFSSLVINASPTSSFKQLQYALGKWNFSYAFSSSFLLGEYAAMKKSFCGLLPVNQDEGDLSSHEDLIRSIKDKLGGVYFQHETNFNLSEVSKQHDFIHISSHGTFSKEQPAKSYLYLPGSNVAKLSLEQLYSTTMSTAPFVVLNACETGEGELRSGEGIDNFTRAFFYSGASGIVESSWKINAEQTASIFKHFYNNLFDGKKTKEALREAKLAYLNDQNIDNTFAHPYYWAGFKHFGAAVTLQKAVHPVSYWLKLCAVATVLILIFVWGNKRRKKYSQNKVY